MHANHKLITPQTKSHRFPPALVINSYQQQYNPKMVKVYYSYSFSDPVGIVSSRICNFAIDPKRKLLITASSQYIFLLSLKTSQKIAHLHKPGKNIPVRYIKISSSRLYAAYEDGQITVWDLDTHELLSSLDLHKSTVSSLAVSEDETRLVSSGLDGSIILWDLLSEEQQVINHAHANAITQVEYLSILYRGKPTNVVLSVGKDGFFKVWQAETKLCISVISTQATEALCMAYNLDRSLIYVGTNKQDLLVIKIHENAEKQPCEVVASIKRKNYTRAQQMILDNNRLYILTQKRLETYELLSQQKLKLRRKRLISRRKQKEGQQAEAQINDYQLHLLALQQKVLIAKIYNITIVTGKVYLNNGTDIVSLEEDKSITDSADRTQQLELQYPFLIQRNNRDLRVYNYNQFNPLFTIPVKATSCSLFNSGFLLLISQGEVALWDLAKNEKIFVLSEEWSGCWAKKNKCLLWRQNQLGLFQIGADAKGRVRMRQSSTKYFQDKISSCMYRHSFDKYAVNLQNSQIHIMYSDSNKNCLKLYGHKLPINSFDISSDDALLATGSTDKDIRFWDMDFGHCIKTLFAHSEAVTSVRFITDTHYLLTGSKDGHLKFWDGDTHQLVMDFDESILQIRDIVISSSGDFIVAGGLDGGFRVWRQGNEQTIAGDQAERDAEKIMIEEYANEQLKQKDVKTRYEDLKHGEQIIEALVNNEQPLKLLEMLRKITPANLKPTLSFLHGSHVAKLMGYLRFLIRDNIQNQLCWRIVEALDRSSDLGPVLRSEWEPLTKTLRVNKQSLKILLKTLREEREFTF